MVNNCKCSISSPHSHFVHGKTFDCEKGSEEISVVGVTGGLSFGTPSVYAKLTTAAIPQNEGRSIVPFVVVI